MADDRLVFDLNSNLQDRETTFNFERLYLVMAIDMTLFSAQPFLKGLPERHLQLLVNESMLMEFGENKVIFREGQVANRFYLLLEGEVALESSAKEKDGASSSIEIIRAGGTLGWSWLFPPYRWHFDARALKSTKAIFIYGIRLRRLCDEDHDLGYELMKRTADIVIEELEAVRGLSSDIK